MKTRPTILSTLFLAGLIPTASAQADFKHFFDRVDRGQVIPINDLLGQPSSSQSGFRVPVPVVAVEAGDVVRQGLRFTDLRLEIYNSWTHSTTLLAVDARGRASIRISGQPQASPDVDVAVSSDEMQDVQALWLAAHLTPGDRFIGRRVPDAPVFNLSYRSCWDGPQMCSDGSVNGSLVPSAWGDQGLALDALMQKLQAILSRASH